MLSDEATNAEIAAALNYSVTTIKGRLCVIFDKLAALGHPVRSRLGAAKAWNGWTVNFDREPL